MIEKQGMSVRISSLHFLFGKPPMYPAPLLHPRIDTICGNGPYGRNNEMGAAFEKRSIPAKGEWSSVYNECWTANLLFQVGKYGSGCSDHGEGQISVGRQLNYIVCRHPFGNRG